MTYDVFFAGFGGTILGTIVGACLSCRLTYSFQKMLLQQQLDFQKRQGEADALLRTKIHEETVKTIQDIRTAISAHGKRIVGQII
jgi:hypothetical protein